MRKTFEEMTASNCYAANTMAIIGGKWKILILYYVMKQPRRFNELQRMLKTVTPHTLSKELKELQEDKLINKKVVSMKPPKTEYTLTTKGEDLEKLLQEVYDFGKKYPVN